MRKLSSHALVGFLWLLHWLPLPVLRGLGWLIGQLLFQLAGARRRVALTNLRLCFPDLDEAARRRLARRHFVAVARAIFDRPLFWWASDGRLRRLIRLRGGEWLPDSGQPTILLAPHFVGLDAGGVVLAMWRRCASMYSNQKNPVFNQVLLAGRMRFNAPLLLSRQDGMRKAVRALKDGLPFYYLPDMDFGPQDSLFVPFFGVPAATVPGVSRLARITGARVLPCITRMTPDGYELTISPPWEGYPSEDLEADTRRMNAFIEEQVRTMPEQYYWVHKRFKTRPPGDSSVY